MGLGRFTTLARRALGPLSSGSKDCDAHNAPCFPRLEFRAFLVGGKDHAFLPWVVKVERIGRIDAYLEHDER